MVCFVDPSFVDLMFGLDNLIYSLLTVKPVQLQSIDVI